VTVPGAAAAWVDTVEKFGSGKLSVAEVLAPAIRLAEEGYVLAISYCVSSILNSGDYRVPVSEIHSHAVSP
jgi:gamma-glutamyltranspeptidase